MRPVRPLAALLLSSSLISGAALAQAASAGGDTSANTAQAAADEALPAQLTLEEALRIFRTRGFDMLLADAQVASARGDVDVAGASPNPTLSGGVSKSFNYDPSCTGCSAFGFSVGISESGALSDLISNKRGLRLDVAHAALAAAQQSREDATRTLELSLKQAWVQALQAEAQLALSAEATQSTDKTRALNEKRFNLGAVSEADFARAEVAELEAEQLHDQATQALATAKAQLAFLLGVRGPMPGFALDPHGLDYAVPGALAALSPPVQGALQSTGSANATAPVSAGATGMHGSATASAAPGTQLTTGSAVVAQTTPGAGPSNPAIANTAQDVPQNLIDEALANRPDLLAQTQQVTRSQSALALARRQRWGDPDLSVTYNQQGTGQDALQPPTLTVGLSIPVALLYQQQGEIAKAEADLRTQQVTLNKSRAQVTSDVRQAWSAFSAARAQMERMDGRLQGRAKRARDLIDVQYEKGAATLLDLLDAQRTLLTVSGERLNLLATYWTSVAQLEAAVAKELRK